MELHESGEMYLETILVLKRRFGYVRSIDIAHELNFSKPSVSRAISLLRDNDYVTFDPNGMILLTEKGQEVAEKIYERHNVLTNYLISLGVSDENASADACKIEHVISDESFSKIKEHYAQNAENPSQA
jgi:Mn-dependent DtxR family transcriptional regulator